MDFLSIRSSLYSFRTRSGKAYSGEIPELVTSAVHWGDSLEQQFKGLCSRPPSRMARGRWHTTYPNLVGIQTRRKIDAKMQKYTSVLWSRSYRSGTSCLRNSCGCPIFRSYISMLTNSVLQSAKKTDQSREHDTLFALRNVIKPEYIRAQASRPDLLCWYPIKIFI